MSVGNIGPQQRPAWKERSISDLRSLSGVRSTGKSKLRASVAAATFHTATTKAQPEHEPAGSAR